MNIKKAFIFSCEIIILIIFAGCSMKEATMLNTESIVKNCENTVQIDTLPKDERDINEQEDNDSVETYICVYICGEVQNPGVYMVKDTARVYEVLMEAGGYTMEADQEAVNLADFVSDGLKINIPLKNIVNGTTNTEETDALVNINTASESELKEIPGVGDVKAKAIIAYRIKNGAFSNVEDIMMVEGIKTATYEKIKEYIRVN